MATVDDTSYAVARRYLKHDLLDPLSTSRGVRRILSCIPRRANVMIGFEARLQGKPHVVDLFLGFGSRQPSSLQIVVEALGRCGPQNSLAIYGALQSFSANWEAESRRREGVDFLWLEYDAPHRSSSVIPGVFLGVGVETRVGNIEEWLSARYPGCPGDLIWGNPQENANDHCTVFAVLAQGSGTDIGRVFSTAGAPETSRLLQRLYRHYNDAVSKKHRLRR